VPTDWNRLRLAAAQQIPAGLRPPSINVDNLRAISPAMRPREPIMPRRPAMTPLRLLPPLPASPPDAPPPAAPKPAPPPAPARQPYIEPPKVAGGWRLKPPRF
jgi:hypothetical protein